MAKVYFTVTEGTKEVGLAVPNGDEYLVTFNESELITKLRTVLLRKTNGEFVEFTDKKRVSDDDYIYTFKVEGAEISVYIGDRYVIQISY